MVMFVSGPGNYRCMSAGEIIYLYSRLLSLWIIRCYLALKILHRK